MVALAAGGVGCLPIPGSSGSSDPSDAGVVSRDHLAADAANPTDAVDADMSSGTGTGLDAGAEAGLPVADLLTCAAPNDGGLTGSCCAIFGFEDGTDDGFAAPPCVSDGENCWATALVAPTNDGETAHASPAACGALALVASANFQAASGLDCGGVFGPDCGSQIGELSAALPEALDLRGGAMLRADVLFDGGDISTSHAEARFLAVGDAVVYSQVVTLSQNATWLTVRGGFSPADDAHLASVERIGIQIGLIPDPVLSGVWQGSVYFDAFGADPPPAKAP